MTPTGTTVDYALLAQSIKTWGEELGFQQIGIADTELDTAEQQLLSWLERGHQGEMAYMARHGTKRSRPPELIPGTLRVISGRLNYLTADPAASEAILGNPSTAYLSRYALGRDYHKLVRKRLQQLADRITETVGNFGYRVFVDSAPVMEKPLAAKAGVGWVGKHSLLINRQASSWFFLGEIYTDLPLPIDTPQSSHCGSCERCIDRCPTQAIVAPYQVDARRCISYLTIELEGAIPLELRPLIGNRIYGCDDCQLACPWNRFACLSEEADFLPRHGLDDTKLTELFSWSESTFLGRTEGMAIRRIGHSRWLRNIAVALGNAPGSEQSIRALQARADDPSPLVREHVAWALAQNRGS